MYTFLLIAHVLTAILFLGPITVSVSTFAKQADAAREGDTSAQGAVRILFRITSAYGVLSALVPILGVALMFTDPGLYWRQGRLHTSLVLAIIAWALLIVVVIPLQRSVVQALGLTDPEEEDEEEPRNASTHDLLTRWDHTRKRLAMFGGIFCTLWVIILVLMLGPVW